MAGRKAWGTMLVAGGVSMMCLSIMEDIRLFGQAGGPSRAIPVVSLGISAWILISARLRGRELAEWMHDLDVLRRHGLSRRHSLLARPLGLGAGLLLSAVMVLTIALVTVRLLTFLVLGLFYSSVAGTGLVLMMTVLGGPALLVGWYHRDRSRIDVSRPGETVTATGIRLMSILDGVARHESRMTEKVVHTLDTTQSALRRVRRGVRRIRR